MGWDWSDAKDCHRLSGAASGLHDYAVLMELKYQMFTGIPAQVLYKNTVKGQKGKFLFWRTIDDVIVDKWTGGKAVNNNLYFRKIDMWRLLFWWQKYRYRIELPAAQVIQP